MDRKEHILDGGTHSLHILGSIVHPQVIRENGDADGSIFDNRTVMGERARTPSHFGSRMTANFQRLVVLTRRCPQTRIQESDSSASSETGSLRKLTNRSPFLDCFDDRILGFHSSLFAFNPTWSGGLSPFSCKGREGWLSICSNRKVNFSRRPLASSNRFLASVICFPTKRKSS